MTPVDELAILSCASRCVFIALVATLVLHRIYVALSRVRPGKTWAKSAPVVLPGLIVLSAAGLWAGLGATAGSAGAASVPVPLKLGAICLYLAGCIVYVELRSLLSRGYSLRILIDLLRSGGRADLDALKASYGEAGAGVAHIIRSRLASIGKMGLLRLGPELAGPLSTPGWIAARAGSWIRRILRLASVG